MESRAQSPVTSTVGAAALASAVERARSVQAILDEHGPEMDRRRELTPEAVDALVAQDLLRLLLPRSLGGQEIDLVDFCRVNETVAWADASTPLATSANVPSPPIAITLAALAARPSMTTVTFPG